MRPQFQQIIHDLLEDNDLYRVATTEMDELTTDQADEVVGMLTVALYDAFAKGYHLPDWGSQTSAVNTRPTRNELLLEVLSLGILFTTLILTLLWALQLIK